MTGGTTIQSGTLTIGGVIDPTNPYSPSSYRAGSLTGDIANEGSLAFDLASLAGTRTYNGTISGNGSLKTTFTYPHYPSGANGTLRLTGNNTFTGGTSVSVGTLDISGGTLASTGSVTVSNLGTLAIGSSNQTIGNFTINYGAATGNGSLTAQRYDLQHGSISLGLAGTADIEKNTYNYSPQPISYDNGRVYLTGNNTSSGNITINSGILSFDNVRSLYSGNNASWTKEKISVSANATLALATGAGGATDGFNNAQITDIFSNLTQNGTGGLAANSKIGFNTTSNFTLTTTITDRPDGGVLGLDKIGGSTLTLDANNTFTGELSVFEGTIALGRSNALRTDSDLVVDSKSDASYGFNVGNYSQQFVDITLKEGLLAGGSGAFIATGNYTMIKGNATANLSGNASLIKTNTSGSSYNVSEPEIVYLSGNNSYTGRTIVDGAEWYGTQSPSPSSNPGAPTKDNAKLQFQTVGSLYGGNATLWSPENISVDSYGIFSLRTGSAGFNATQVSTIIQNLITANRSTGGFLDKSVLGIDTNGENLVINDDIGDTTGLTSGGGAVGLVKYGSGTLTLNGNSTRSFSTSVTGGNLVLGANATLSSASANLLVDNALLNMGATNQTVRKVTVTSGYILGSGTLTSSADGFVFGTANITANLAGAVGATIDSYSGTTTLSGNNSFTGNTTIGSSATLSLANVNALAGSTLVFNYGIPAATLQLSVAGANTYNLGGLTGTGNLSMGANSLTIGANSQNTIYSGSLSGTGSMTKTGNGTLTLTGNNTYTGGTTISGGTLSITNNGLITHTLVDTNIGNGTLNLSSGSISNARGNIGVNAGSTGVATVSGGNWTNSGNFTVGDSGNGTLNLSGGLISNTGNYSYIGLNTGSTGVANVSGGNWTNGEELRVGDSGNGTLNITGGTVSNTAGFLAYGNGSTGVVNVSGGTWSNSDRLRLGRYGNGTLNLTGGNVSIAGGAGNLTVTVHSSSTGILNIGNGSTAGNLQAARVTAGSGTAIVNFNHSGNHSFSPILEGNLTVNQIGSGTTILTGNSTYTGGTFVSSGTLQGNTQSLQGAITNNASLVFNQTTNGTYTGVMSGSGDLSKIGNGTLTLSGNSSSFNGTAAINSGIVSLTGSMANASTTINNGGILTGNGSLGAVTINSGGILTGNGTAGVVTINSGGSINPGNSPGILTVGNSVWNGGGIYNWELASANGTAGTGWDLIDSTGNLTITANSSNRFIINASTNNASVFNPNVKNASWKIAEFDGGISGFSADAFSINATGFANLPSMYAFGITSNGTALNFSYATVATWIGGTGNWTNTADWDTGFAPINGVAVDYAGTNGTSTNDSTVVNIGGLTFTNNASGSFTLAGGALSIGTGGITNDSAFTNTIGMDLVLGANQTFAANTANLVVSGNISGNSSLTKAGNQTLTFSGNNTYTSTTTISAGTLQIASANALGSGGNITFGGGTLQFGSGITTDVSSRLKNSVTAIQIDTDNNNITFASDVDATNTGGLKKLGSGNLTLTGNNTYTGDTMVKNGTLALPVGGSISSAGNMTIGSASGDNGALTISGGNVSNAVGSIGNDAGSVGAVTVSSGNWTNSGQLYVGNGGTGNLTISGGAVSNGWTEVAAGGGSVGNILVNGGTWNSGSLYLGLSGNGTLNLSGGVINASGFSLGHYALGSGFATVASGTLANSGELNIGLWGTGSLSISGSGNVTNSNSLLGGAVGASGSVAVSGGTWVNTGVLNIGGTGAGNLTISGGSVSNTVGYLGNDASGNGVASVSGGTWANSGDLVIGNSGTGSLMISGGIVTNTTGYVALGFGSNGTVNVSGGTWANSGALTIGYDGTGSLTINGTGTVTNAIGNIGYGGGGNGTVNISGGTWANSSYLFIGALNGSRGSLTINSGNVTNTDGYVGNGASSNGTASVSGGTWANSGELTIGRDGTGSLAISGGNVTNTSGNIGSNAGSNGTVNVSGGTWTNSSNLAVGGAGTGSLTINGTGTVIVGDTLSRGSNGTINLASGGTLQIGTGGDTGTLATDLTNDGTLLFDRSTESTYSSVISGTGAVIKNGSGTLVFTNNNTYTGGTSINFGTLYLRTDIFTPAGESFNIGNMTVASGATLMSERGSLVGNLTLNGGTWVENNGFGSSLAGSVALGATSTFRTEYSQTVTANITGSGGLIKTGAGSLILSGNNSYSGTTAVNSGTLLVNGSQSSSPTTVNSGGTLGGNGTLGAVTITSGGAIAPGTGDSLSILTVGNSVWNGGGTYNWQLGNAAGEAGAGWDLISASGISINATSSNKFTINATALGGSDFDPSARIFTWKIAESATPITGFAGDKFNILTNNFAPGIGAYFLSANQTSLNLNYATMAAWNAGTGNWTTSSNWESDFAPINGLNVEYAGPNGSGGTSDNNSGLANILGLEFTSGANASYTIAGGNLTIGEGGIVNNSTSTQTVAINLTLGADQTFAANTANLVVSGNISGDNALTKEGNQTLTLSGSNTYAGSTTVNAGTLAITGNVSGTEDVSIKSATLAVQAGGLLLTGTGGSLSVGDASGDNGTLQISGGSLASATAKIGNSFGSNGTANMSAGTWTTQSTLSVGFGGTGVLNLSGGFVSNDVGFVGDQDGSTGMVNMSNGTWTNNSFLDIGGSGTGTLNLSGGSITAANGSIAKYTGSTGIANITGGSWFNNNSLTIGDMGNGTLNLSGGILSVGTNGTGTVDLAKTAGSSGTLNWGNGTSVGSLLAGGITGGAGTAVVNLNFTGNSTIGAVFAGGLSLNQIGTGTSILTANNTHTGGTTVSSGTLQLGNGGTSGSVAGDIVNNAVLAFNRSDDLTHNGIVSGTGTLEQRGTGTTTLSGNNTYSGGTTVNAGTLAGTTSSLQGAIDNNSTVNFDQSTNGTYAGAMSGTGVLVKNGSGTVTLSGANSYTGGTTVNAGTLSVNGTIGSVTNNAAFTVQQGGLAGSVNNSAGAIGTNNGTVASLANAGNFTNSGNITGGVTTNGALSSSGSIDGALTIGGRETTISGTVAGPTTISAGVLQGNGTLGVVTLNSGGTIAPGTGNGTAMITVGNSLWNGGGIYNWQTSSLNGTAGANWDLISSTGALTLNATTLNPITISMTTLGGTTLADVKKASWEVGNFTQGITGFAKNVFSFNATAMAGNDGRYFMSLGSGNTTLVLNYKSAATWNTGSGNWTTDTQWEDDSLPENGDEVEFAGTIGGISTNNFAAGNLSGNLSYISGFNFVEGAGAYTVNGNTLQIGEDGIINASSNLQTIGMDLTAGNELVVNAAAGDIAISGAISGNSALTKTGNATLKLTGNNNYTAGTLVSAGTLAGTTTGLQGAIANNAVVNFEQAFNGTYAGAMSGTGSLTKSGIGIVQLSGNNSYSGGTTINSGVLSASVITGNLVTLNPNAFGTGGVAINAGGAMLGGGRLAIGNDLTLNNGTIAFYDIGTSPEGQDLRIDVAGNFTNAGNGVVFDFSQVQALDSGNYTLVSYNGTNFATNAISSRAGVGTTLQGSFSINGSSLVYTVLGAQSSGTDIQNNGGPNTPIVSNYTINQPGVVTIGQSNTVAGLTFNSGGSLNIQSNGVLNVTSGTLNVQSGSSVVGGGTLVAPAGLNKDGTGELDFTNNVVVTGTAAVNAGLLSVNGQLSANSVVVNPTATLGGAGVIVAPNVVVNGNLSPGNSPGTLNVVGNLVLTGANSTIIEIASPTNFDRIVVSGTATLGGTLNALAYGGGTITPGTRYEFLEAGSIVGEFDSLVAPEGLRVRFLSSGTVGTLLFGPESFVPYAIDPNQRKMVKALDTFIVATDGDRLTVSIALDSLTTEQFPAAFDQIMPGFYESLANIAIEQAFAQTQMLNQRISSVRLGAAGFQAIGGISQPLVHDKNGKSAAEAKDASPIVESATATNWNSWALGTGMFSRTTNLGSVDNYNNDAGGFLVGTDYRWSENFVTGLYGGYDYSYVEYNGGGSTKGNSFNFGTYASYAKDGYYADAVIGGGYTGFQTKRSIEFSTIDRTASADPNSGQFTAGLNLGKDFEVGKFTLGPIIGAQYTYAGIGSFTESGAESLDLSLGQQNANSLRSTLGGRIAYTWNLNQKIALIPEVRMFWQHEFLNNPRNISSSLDGGNGAAFDFETSDPYRDSVFAGVGVTAQFGERWNASLFYNVNFGSQTYQSNMVSAGLNFSF